jgi:hypothetical protein
LLIGSPKGCRLHFKYTINTTVNENSSVKDLIITGYSINEEDIIETNETTLTETIPLSSENKVINIRVFIKWDDGENSIMTNEDDTLATITNDAKLDVSLTFTQVII